MSAGEGEGEGNGGHANDTPAQPMNLSGNYTIEFFRDAKKIMAEESYR